MEAPVRIAMWSGPRNLSTALLRSFGSRADTAVVDEPLYAHYLAVTGKDHPGRDEVLARHESNAEVVIAALTGPAPGGRPIVYQKHMAHHLLPDVGREWLGALRHAFLIRSPRSMLASLLRVLPEPTLEDTGLPQQVALLEQETARRGAPPPVLDADDLLAAPEALLRRLCAALEIPFDPAMLAWEPGPRDTDGCWGEHWYAGVWASTGFAPPRPDTSRLPDRWHDLLARCEALHARLHALRLTPD